MMRIGGLWAPSSEMQVLSKVRVVNGVIDLDVTKVDFATRYCTSRNTALDIGAAARLLAKTFRRVVAFEPIPATCAALSRNTRELENGMTCEGYRPGRHA